MLSDRRFQKLEESVEEELRKESISKNLSVILSRILQMLKESEEGLFQLRLKEILTYLQNIPIKSGLLFSSTSTLQQKFKSSYLAEENILQKMKKDPDKYP